MLCPTNRPGKNHRKHPRSGVGASTRKDYPKKNRGPLVSAPSTALTLPRFDAGVPLSVEFPVDQRKSQAGILRNLLDLGLVDKDVAASEKTILEMVHEVFSRWFKQKTRGLVLFEPGFTLCDDLQEAGFCEDEMSQFLNDADFPETKDYWAFLLWFNTYPVMVLKKRVEEFEHKVPGLAETALSILYNFLGRMMLAFSPWHVIDVMQNFFWMGCEDETQYMLEFGESPDSYDGITRKEFDTSLPPLCTQPRQKLNQKSLRQLCKHEDPAVQKLAQTLISIDVENSESPLWPEAYWENGEQVVEPGIALRWTEDDLLPRIYDDMLEYAMQVGTSDLNGIILAQDSLEGIASALNRLSRYIDQLRQAETLILMLSQRVE